MVGLTLMQASNGICSLPLAIGLFLSASAVIALCAKQARKASRKREEPTRNELKSPKHLGTTGDIEAVSFRHNRCEAEPKLNDEEHKEEGYEEEGLWQKSILMGEKCQPLGFSGVIYYDCSGKRIDELPPKSPRIIRIKQENENGNL